MKKIILTGAATLCLIGTASAQQPTLAPTGNITRAAAIADAEQQFRALDADGSGTLEPAELQKGSEERRAQARQRMEERLGEMSAEERARIEQRREERGAGETGARQGGRERGPRAGDRSENRPTTLDEFRSQAEQRFDRLDLDSNGVITSAEQAQLRNQRNSQGE